MLRIDRRVSVMLSYVFCALAAVGIGFLVYLLLFGGSQAFPNLQSTILREQRSHGIWTYLLEGLMLALVLFADVCLMLLLNNVRKGTVFTESSVLYLRLISWAAILSAVACIPLYVMLHLFSMLCITFVGFFLGIVLRVVKNVIEEGTAIKAENDSTI